MGMAASQARFLGLTARKTNVEYEGQQINQSRTTLANQSANLYNQMLTMKVPIPPNVEDYSRVEYAFSKPGSGEACSIKQLIPTTGGKYTVQYTYNTKAVGYFASNDPADAKYVTCTDATTGAEKWEMTTVEGRKELQACTVAPHDEAATEIVAQYNAGHTPAIAAADVRYVNFGTEEDPRYLYFVTPELTTTLNENKLTNFYENGAYETVKELIYENVSIETTPDNRVSSLTLSAADGGFNLTCVTETKVDTAAYNDAMNQYTYENEVYQQKLNEINASIEIVQAEDRTLELRLKQLDTEQNAIQTEMDAVSKVLDKNIETTFKTFG